MIKWLKLTFKKRMNLGRNEYIKDFPTEPVKDTSFYDWWAL